MSEHDDEQDDLESQPKEGMDLRADGTVHIWIDGTKRRLRRPRLREFRRLREEYQDSTDRMSEKSAEVDQVATVLVARLEERRKDDPGAKLTPEEKQQDRDSGRALTSFIERECLEWWVEVFDTLGHERNPALEQECVHPGEGHDQGDHDDCSIDRTVGLPPWMGTVKAAGAIVGHWRTAPSLSGVR